MSEYRPPWYPVTGPPSLGSLYASGGTIPESGDRSDTVPAILNDGCGYTLPRRDGQAHP